MQVQDMLPFPSALPTQCCFIGADVTEALQPSFACPTSAESYQRQQDFEPFHYIGGNMNQILSHGKQIQMGEYEVAIGIFRALYPFKICCFSRHLHMLY